MNENRISSALVRLLFVLLLHVLVLATLARILGMEEFAFCLWILMGIDELLLCGQTGRKISNWIFGTEETPGLARVVLFVVYLRSVYKELHADHETGTADNK